MLIAHCKVGVELDDLGGKNKIEKWLQKGLVRQEESLRSGVIISKVRYESEFLSVVDFVQCLINIAASKH